MQQDSVQGRQPDSVAGLAPEFVHIDDLTRRALRLGPDPGAWGVGRHLPLLF